MKQSYTKYWPRDWAPCWPNRLPRPHPAIRGCRFNFCALVVFVIPKLTRFFFVESRFFLRLCITKLTKNSGLYKPILKTCIKIRALESYAFSLIVRFGNAVFNADYGVTCGSEPLCLEINAARLLPLDTSMLCGVVELEQELRHGAGHLGSAPGRPGSGLYQKQICLQWENC